MIGCGVCVVGLGGAGTVSHRGGRVDFTLCCQGRGGFGWCCLVSPVSPCRPSGLRIKSAMTGRCMSSFSPSPLIPLPSRERGIRLVLSCFTRVALPPLWIADQVRNDRTMHVIVFTLTFDSSPIKGERGIWLVLSCSPVPPCRPVDTALKPV